MSRLVGRKPEIETLNRLYQSEKSEFVAIYGRRRVGKTFLINQLYGHDYAFSTYRFLFLVLLKVCGR
ncbi:MAG: ATP-binding protein [Bacteroidota bacterium]